MSFKVISLVVRIGEKFLGLFYICGLEVVVILGRGINFMWKFRGFVILKLTFFIIIS